MLPYRFAAIRPLSLAARRNIASNVTVTKAKSKKTIQQLAKEIDLSGKSVLVRADLNLPRSKEDGSVTDDTRARAVVPTVQFLLQQGAKVILCSHGGRPNGEVVESMRLEPVAPILLDLLDQAVAAPSDCVGEVVQAQVAQVPTDTVVLLENVRFHKGETTNDPEFAQKLRRMFLTREDERVEGREWFSTHVKN